MPKAIFYLLKGDYKHSSILEIHKFVSKSLIDSLRCQGNPRNPKLKPQTQTLNPQILNPKP